MTVKPECSEKTTDLPQVTDKLDDIMLYLIQLNGDIFIYRTNINYEQINKLKKYTHSSGKSIYSFIQEATPTHYFKITTIQYKFMFTTRH